MIYTILVLLILTILSTSLFVFTSQKVISKTNKILIDEKELAMDLVVQEFIYYFIEEDFNYSSNGFEVSRRENLTWDVKHNEKVIYEITGWSEFLVYYIEISNLQDMKITYNYEMVGLFPKLVGKWKSEINE